MNVAELMEEVAEAEDVAWGMLLTGRWWWLGGEGSVQDGH